MDHKNEQLQAIIEIRSLMERSSRFISLSGLSGIFAGIFALLGTWAAYSYLNIRVDTPGYYHFAILENGQRNPAYYTFFFADAVCVLLASIGVGIILTKRKAKEKGQAIWDSTAKRLLINLMIPLVAGGLFCLILLFHGYVGLVAPATLLFYGLSILNASKYTLDDVRYLGISEIFLGLIGSFFIGYGLLFWAMGFGLFHIIYGIIMYYKYEK